MSKLVLDIDGYIGGWGYSKQLVRNFLSEAGKKPVDIRISSLGGDVDHALDIHNQLAAHGNATAIFSGFNASSATIIALGAKHSKIADNSFYLIHKAMIWIDEWGSLNEDDIQDIITRLENEKKEVAKITLVIAKMYADKTGSTTQDILALMKKETWLTAQEAVDQGFVDEIFTPKAQEDPVQNQKAMAFLNASDLPKLPTQRKRVADSAQAGSEGSTQDNLFDRVKKFTSKLIKTQLNMKKFTALFAVLMVDHLDSADEQGVYLNETQLSLIDNSLAALKQEEIARQTAEANLATATGNLALFDEIDPTVAEAETPEAKVAAIKAYMTRKPAVQPSGVQSDGDSGNVIDGVDYDVLMSLPHMQEPED